MTLTVGTRLIKGEQIIGTVPISGPPSIQFVSQQIGGESIPVVQTVRNGDFKKPNNFYFYYTRYLTRHAHKRIDYVHKSNATLPLIRGLSDIMNYGPQLLDANQPETIDYRWATPSDRNALRDRCLEKVFNHLKGDLNVAVDLAESASTLRMLRSQAALADFTHDFLSKVVVPKKLRYGSSKGQQRLDYVTSKWLEVQLGWKPLVSSIYDGMDELLKEFAVTEIPIKVRASRIRQKNETTNRMIDGTPYLGVSDDMHEQVTVTRRLSMRTEMSLTISPPDPLSIYNWTSLDPAVIAWELVPLSFVADYCVNIGQTLQLFENWRMFKGLFRFGYTTETSKSDIDATLGRFGSRTRPLATGTQVSSYKETNARHQRNVEYRRAVLTSFPMPSGQLRFEPKLGALRQLNVAALFHQLVGKKLRVIERGLDRSKWSW